MSVLLGLDVQQLRIGWGAVDLDSGATGGCGVLLLDQRSQPMAVRAVLARINGFLDYDGPALVYVEAAHVGPSRMGALRHAMVIGQVVQACDRRWPNAPVQLITSPEWKRTCDLPGNASKAAVFASALMLGFHPEDQDAADAACIAYAGWRRNVELLAAAERWA